LNALADADKSDGGGAFSGAATNTEEIIVELNRAGFVTRAQLIGMRRYMIVAAFVLAAVLTLSNLESGGAEVVVTVPGRIAYARPRSVIQRATNAVVAWILRLRGSFRRERHS